MCSGSGVFFDAGENEFSKAIRDKIIGVGDQFVDDFVLIHKQVNERYVVKRLYETMVKIYFLLNTTHPTQNDFLNTINYYSSTQIPIFVEKAL